jgi:CRISPR type IV-associated protein Csf3
MQNTMYEPLKIRAYLQTGIISDQFLPLDGILYNVKVRENFGEQTITKPLESLVREESGKTRLPFERANNHTLQWYYHCSFAQWYEDMVEDHQTYSKRFDLKYSDVIDFKGKTSRFDTKSGRFKNYFIKVYYRTASYVDWFAKGDKEELERLLKFVTHLGKKTSQGWGAVLKWEVEKIENDFSIYKDEKLIRAIPIKENGFLYGIRPSYWNPKHQFICKMPE